MLWWLVVGCSAPVQDPAEAPDPAPGSTELRFVALGDVGKGTSQQARVAESVRQVCEVQGCDLLVLLGDNLYPRGMQRADDPRMDEVLGDRYGQVAPVYMVHGNHDYAHGQDHERARWARQWAQRTSGFEHPSPWYGFQAGPARFLALDTTHAFWSGAEPQRTWLEESLARSGADWTVVFGHHPLRSNAQHGNAGAYEGWSSVPWMSGRSVATLLEPLCGAADLYLSGHDHTLQWGEHCGLTWVVSGAGSASSPLVDRGNDTRFERSDLGFFWVHLGEQMHIRAYDRSGQVVHEGWGTRR